MYEEALTKSPQGQQKNDIEKGLKDAKREL